MIAEKVNFCREGQRKAEMENWEKKQTKQKELDRSNFHVYLVLLLSLNMFNVTIKSVNKHIMKHKDSNFFYIMQQKYWYIDILY